MGRGAPGRQLRGGEDEQKTLRYAALPCGVIACKLLAPQTPQGGRDLGQVVAIGPRCNRCAGRTVRHIRKPPI